MLVNGDKVVAKKDILGVISEGDICKVIDVSKGFVSFAFGENFMHKGVTTISEFEECFEKYNEVVVAPKVTQERIDEIIKNSKVVINTVFDKCTIVSCQLPNGFVITESSACVSPENYDEDMGVDICLNKIENKLWELEGYRLQQELFEEYGSPYPCNECPCDGYCDECCDEEEDDLVDCDDCDDYDCPYNTNRPLIH